MADIYVVSAPFYPLAWLEERTKLNGAIAAAATSSTVDNNEGFSANDYIAIGTLGEDTTEIVKISGTTGDTGISHGAVNFAHADNEVITKLPFNQVRFYRRDTASGTSTLDGTENLQVDNKELLTIYASTTTDARLKYWGFVYYNSTSTNQTSESDAEFILGTRKLYASPGEVRETIQNFNTDEISDGRILLFLDAATEWIDSYTNSAFQSFTITDEYHDGKGDYDSAYFTKHKPIIAVSSLSTTQNSDDTDASDTTWNSITEDDDFFVDTDTGRIAITNDSYKPVKGKNRLKVTYTYGRSNIPMDVRIATTMLAAAWLSKTSAENASIMGHTIPEALPMLMREVVSILGRYRQLEMANT